MAVNMAKNMAVLAIMSIIAVLFIGCANNNIAASFDYELAEYRKTAKADIQTYADSKIQKEYTADNRISICNIVSETFRKIDSMQAKSDIHMITMTSKALIDSLDLQLIDQGVPINDELRLEVGNLYKSWAISMYGQDYPWKDTDSFLYYGRYKDFHVLKYTGWYFSYHKEYIGGLDFSYPGVGDIYVVSETIGGTLKDLFERGYLTQIELEEINRIHIAIFADYFYYALS